MKISVNVKGVFYSFTIGKITLSFFNNMIVHSQSLVVAFLTFLCFFLSRCAAWFYCSFTVVLVISRD